jgi:predicted unusual protein kinase regulating ubiquinone biosynthesis (AarF/ABC1/UbiB family)
MRARVEILFLMNPFVFVLLFSTIKASGKDYLMEHLGTYISYICEAAAEHHIMLNPAFVSAALAVKVQEGIALALDPRCKVQHVAIPIIVESEARRTASHIFDLDRVKRAIFGDDGNDNKQNG